MLLRQTTIKGGRQYNLLTHLGRRSLNNNATNSRQKSSLLFVLRNNNNSLISAPIVQQQQQQYGGQGGNYSYKSNQAAIMTAAVASTAAMATAASSTEDDLTNRNLKSTQKIFANNTNSNICHCEEATTNPKQETTNEITATSTNSSNNNNEEEDNLPTYTMSQVSNYNGQLSPTNPNKRIWMSYGGMVYDVTEFIANHPGGSEKILMGAGGPVEPYWYCEFDCCVVGLCCWCCCLLHVVLWLESWCCS